MNVETYTEYCTGCGICHDVKQVEFKEAYNKFKYPVFRDTDSESFCEEICPIGPNALSETMLNSLWGNYVCLVSGYSQSEIIREKASSGGIITSICIYLLDIKAVDAIIHTMADPDKPYKTITAVSHNKEELICRSGSRYSESNPLENIHTIVKEKMRYAFVGKPCDVVALANYMKKTGEFQNEILYKFSFFCAGTPSIKANINLLKALGVEEKNCKSISYRGNGWPGLTTVTTVDNDIKKMTYDKSWMNILGKDIRKSCKFCFDSIGEKSDISCGDYWYLDDNNKPDFSDHKGRNCIFTWTEKGNQLLLDAVKAGYIAVSYDIDEYNLSLVQPNHYSRRGTLLSRLYALKIFNRNIPQYKLERIKTAAHLYGLNKQPRAFVGTIKRIIKGKI